VNVIPACANGTRAARAASESTNRAMAVCRCGEASDSLGWSEGSAAARDCVNKCGQLTGGGSSVNVQSGCTGNRVEDAWSVVVEVGVTTVELANNQDVAPGARSSLPLVLASVW
jgi:hypothetical protein